MATLEQLESALVKADAAGNVDDAKAFAAEIRNMRGATAKPTTPQKQTIYNEDTVYDPVTGVPISSGGYGEGAKGATKAIADVATGVVSAPVAFAAGASRPLSSIGRMAGMQGAKQMGEATTGLTKGLAQVNDSQYLIPATELAGEIAGTAGAGNVLSGGVSKVAPKATQLIEALRTGGMSTGGAAAPLLSREGAKQLAIRGVGGTATGGAGAGLVNPEDTGVGMAIGAALPVTGKLLGAAGQKLGGALRGGEVAPEVVALAQRAKDLGIDIPADRLTDSKFMNAIASGLNYVPFSGRAATEQKMADQLNTAASRLVGQDTKNMSQALRNAKTDLGSKFDSFLKDNTIKVDDALKAKTAEILQTAEKELGSDALKPIQNQIAEIFTKGASGEIDGQAAYNIKKTLDRIGKGQGSEAFHARELRDGLMDALERSVGPEKAAEFAKVRQQYGNMKSLEKIAQNGAEGEISIARLANMKNIGNRDLQELADISAQFVKPREGQHGAMQRGFAALGVGSMAGLPALGGSIAAGRTANTLLNSQAAKNFMLNQNGSPQAQALANALRQALPVTAPVIGAQ